MAAAFEISDAQSFQVATGATSDQVERLERYRVLLADWNERLNLVGPSAMAEFWNRHAFDSWQLLPLAPQALTWADLGTGAGLPGIVIAAFLKGRDGAEVHLVETLAKRCRFLAEVVAELDLPARVHNARAEDLSLPVDVVTARACAPFVRLFRYAEPHLARGATGLFLKGETAEGELEAARESWTFEADLQPSLSDSRGRVVTIRSLQARARKR